ncbi:endoribonuclease Dicer [Plodia interpunctella]|uniref:endoribonuclease Dicer n=1 Tax=Plodia interpunctella TaxID=58824 RepID=UPI0023688116|nr:endoribonuclease Dicer [Plodia interpunctella]
MEVDSNEVEQLKSRPYQTELEEIAIKQNTIIHLPTGSGKTLIAIQLIKRCRGALQDPWGQGGKRTFFLVNNVPLVDQQRKAIQKICPVEGVGAYSSEDRVDYWDKNKWDEELSKNQVIVMTCQILSDMITHGYIRIQDINLLIFDECHHAVEDHPMRVVMKHFESCPPYRQPRVLGLTATLLNANVNLPNVPNSLRDLETTFHATIATVNELGEVLTYSTNPKEMVQYYRAPIPTAATMEAKAVLLDLKMQVISVKLPVVTDAPLVKLEVGQIDISRDPKKIVKAVKNMITCMISLIEDLGVYGGSLGIVTHIILLERLKRKSLCKEEEMLFKFVITHCVMARAILLKSMEKDTGYEKIVNHSSEKVLQLLNIIKEYNPATVNTPGVTLRINSVKKPLSGIIFTQQRFMAKLLYNLLKNVSEVNPKEFGFLKHDFIVGFNVNPFKNTREQHYQKKTSQKALLKFKHKDLNCLISTSVIEEGVDIPQCMLVVRFDPPLEYRSYIQSKGRARSAESTYVILVDETNRSKFENLYMAFQKTERLIQNILVGKSESRVAPTEQELQSNLYEDDDIPPYVTMHGNTLSATSAISLLNRYCSMLPHDQFTVITPMWIQENVEGKLGEKLTVVTIIMPLACPVRESIKGDPQPNLKSAKRSAALKACIRLHQEGELDEISLLPKQYGMVNFDQSEIKSCFPNWPWDTEEEVLEDVPKAGTKKRMRKHPKVFPTCLKGPSNWTSGLQNFHLHIIQMKTAFPEPKDSRERALYGLLQSNRGFGFLTTEKLPKLCSFPMFLTVGEVTTNIEVNYAVVPLSVPLFQLIKRFHFLVFDQVLGIAKKFLVFDGTENCMYFVPTKFNGDYDIDWDIMKTHTHIPPITVPTIQERVEATKSVSLETHKNCVVTPWYRSSIWPDRYIVSNVLEYMTPMSLFEAQPYGTYANYYSSRYNLEIMGRKDQPMLEVRNISSRMNCLLPRAATINAFTEKQQKIISAVQGDDKPNSFAEAFIPEFCIKYDFPGDLWYKAMMLPSIVHRVHMLLVADELRASIARDTKLGQETLLGFEEWKPIEVHLQVAITALRAQADDTPAPINTIDRINNPIDDTQKPPLNILTMKDTLYKLLMKNINKEYSWDEKMEPLDIERNINTVTVMDIECYDEFVSAPAFQTKTGNMKSPLRMPTSTKSAILPPPLKYNDRIGILDQKITPRGPELRDVLAALTAIKSHDTFNLERVETLGDSFLKFAASLYLYHKFPLLQEGQLTNIKGRLIGNRNLYYAGERVNLSGRMKIEQFSPKKDFLVPGFFAPLKIRQFIEQEQIRPSFLIGMQFSPEEVLSGELSDESLASVDIRHQNYDGVAEREPAGFVTNSMQCYVQAQAVSDKSVADCVEALIGTYLLSDGILGAVKILEWFKVLPQQDNFVELLHKAVPTAQTEGRAKPEEIDFLLNSCSKDIERILGYKFKDTSFLLEALSHPSYIRNRLTRSYERLEFLGDAILDFLITCHIFENCENLKPGELTDLRSALVNNVTFASYVVKLGLHKYMCSQLNPKLNNAIIAFVEHQEQRDHEILEDVLYLIDEEDCQIAEYVEVPKVLSDIFESLVGAIYLDCGGQLQTVWAVVYRVMWHEIEMFSRRIPQQPVKTLYERIHACPVFQTAKVADTAVPRVMIPVTISKEGRQLTVYGFGGNKFQAKRAAAKLALRVLSL